MTKLTTAILPTVLLATFAPTLVVAQTYFTGYQNGDCTGDEPGTFPSSQGDKRYEEVKFKPTPGDLTVCNEAMFRAGTTTTKDMWVLVTCPTGSNTQVNISTYKGNTGMCSNDNQMGYYMIDASEVTKLIAGNCAKATLTITWGATNQVSPTERSVKITGFTGNAEPAISSMCGQAAPPTDTTASSGSGSSPTPAPTTAAPAGNGTGTTKGSNLSSKSGLPHSFFAAPLAIFVGAALL